MERCGHFLETGSYNGHYYGTPKPLLSDLVMAENNATKSRTVDEAQTIDENIEQVTIHENSDEVEEKKESYLKLNKASNSEQNNLKSDEVLDNQPINV